MEGNAIDVPCACVWLAYLNGIEPDISSYIMLAILSTIGSCPGVGLVLYITTYNTVFGGSGIPEGFSFLLAIDWLSDRLMTVLNVTGNMVVAGMVASMCEGCDDDDDDDELSKISMISTESEETPEVSGEDDEWNRNDRVEDAGVRTFPDYDVHDDDHV